MQFTIFPNLPTELQLKIWKHAIPEPRIMKVEVQTKIDEDGEARMIFTTNDKPSALLRACKKSRQAILESYTVCLATKNSCRKIRLDGDKDVVCLWSRYSPGYDPITLSNLPFIKEDPDSHLADRIIDLSDLEDETFSGIRTLAIRIYLDWDIVNRQVLRLLCAFTSLEKLIVLSNASRCLDPALESEDAMSLCEVAKGRFPHEVQGYANMLTKRDSLLRSFDKYKEECPAGWLMPEISFQTLLDEVGKPYSYTLW
jgi:hypothetical protein